MPSGVFNRVIAWSTCDEAIQFFARPWIASLAMTVGDSAPPEPITLYRASVAEAFVSATGGVSR